MAIKRISFLESQRYYLKNFNEYKRKECHTNTFQRFFDCNVTEVENNEKAFKYSIGLMLYNDGVQRICYIHSWIEKHNEVIDVTPFANVNMTDTTPLMGVEYEEFVKKANEARYLSIKTISNSHLNRCLRELFYGNSCKDSLGASMEKLIKVWIDEVVQDSRFVEQIRDYNYNLIEE